MKFEFMTANRIIFERGSISKIGKLAKGMGTKALISSGMPERDTDLVIDYLKQEGIGAVTLFVQGEPTIEGIENGVALAKKENCDMLIGFGGGSAMDTAKAISVMLTNPGEVLDYLEVIGKGQTLSNPSAPCIAIPTTSGTGAEVTKNAVLGSKQHKVKVSMRSPYMLPDIVLSDPELTRSVPPAVTASTGLDALTQVLEPFVSNAANPLTDALCREGLSRAARSLKKAFDQGDDIVAREDMAITSLFGGLALANAKLGAVHGFASVLGGKFPIPHGVACATLLPYTIEANVKALTERDPESEALKRFDEIARILTGRPDAKAADAVAWIQEICNHLRVPGLATFGMTPEDWPEVIAKTKAASSTKGNPIVLTDEELGWILRKAM
ncbi:MAG: iron-containing alcohol dehydrogenase [Bacillota bacterium]